MRDIIFVDANLKSFQNINANLYARVVAGRSTTKID